jgi:hypothetical protein
MTTTDVAVIGSAVVIIGSVVVGLIAGTAIGAALCHFFGDHLARWAERLAERLP